jgi:hypothetical protein
MPEDADAARAFVRVQLASTRHLARAEEQLDSALEFEDPEYMALLALDDDDALLALALFGTVAGARQCVKLHAIVGTDERAMTTLVAGIAQLCDRSGERLIVCELPDDAPWDRGAAVLLANGYREEGRVPDYLRDGVALRLLVRRP